MSNPTSFLAIFNGTLDYTDTSGTGTMGYIDPVRYKPVADARVNLFPNPSFEVDTSTWVVNGGTSITRVEDDSGTGSYCLEVVASTSGFGVTNNASQPRIAVGTTYTLSFYYWLVSGASDWRASGNCLTAAGSSLGSQTAFSNTAFTPTATPQRFSISFAPSTAGTERLQIYIARLSSVASTIRLDGFMLEESSSVTEYFDGSTNGVWLDPRTGILGTAHASPSVERAVAWVEEGTTNLVTNPWFATSTTGWSATNAAIARSTAYSYQGPSAATLTATTTNATATTSITAAASSHTAQWIVRNRHTVARTVQLKYDGSNIGSTASVDPGETLTVTAPFTGTGGAANLELVVTDSANTEVMVIYYAGAESKSYATSPCPAINASGTVQTGYAWTGTAHASTSTRAASSVSVDQDTVARIDPASGSIAFRYTRNIDTAAEEIILTSGVVGSGTDYLEIGIDSTDHFYAEWNSNNAGANRVTSTGTISVDTEYLLYTDWDGTAIRVSIDNGAFDTDTRDAVEGDWSTGDLTIQAA